MSVLDRKKLNLEIFETLPSEIIIKILSRLPVRSVINCKCVCKSWLTLIKSHEFFKSHLSNSVSGIVMFVSSKGYHYSKWYGVIELMDVLNVGHNNFDFNAITKLNFPNSFGNTLSIEGSTDGLLLLCKGGPISSLCLCNPITREYIDLSSQGDLNIYSCGFGKSKVTGKYKVVMFIQLEECTSLECMVYTIGTGSWRTIASDAQIDCEWSNYVVFLNGNLHWLTRDSRDSSLVSCFDLETELFTTFCAPTASSETCIEHLSALEDCLWLCYNTNMGGMEIWLMDEYGVEKSWTKKFAIATFPKRIVFPFKVFKDGDILLSCINHLVHLYGCSSKNKMICTIDMPEIKGLFTPAHISSFLSLKSFVMENSVSY